MSDKFETIEPGTLCELSGISRETLEEFGVFRGSVDDLDIPQDADWIGDLQTSSQLIVIRDTREFTSPYGGVLFLSEIGPIWVNWWFMVHIRKVLTP